MVVLTNCQRLIVDLRDHEKIMQPQSWGQGAGETQFCVFPIGTPSGSYTEEPRKTFSVSSKVTENLTIKNKHKFFKRRKKREKALSEHYLIYGKNIYLTLFTSRLRLRKRVSYETLVKISQLKDTGLTTMHTFFFQEIIGQILSIPTSNHPMKRNTV